MIRLSSGLRRAVVTNTGLGSMLNGGRIYIYAGAQPESADLAAPLPPLAIVTQDGDPRMEEGGLLLAQGDVAGTLTHAGVWIVSGLSAGTAAWWRFVGDPLDAGTYESPNAVRLDGAMGEGFSAQGFPLIALEAFIEVDRFLLSLSANN